MGRGGVLACFLLILLSPGLAFEFNGTVKDIDGNPLNDSLVNVTMRNMGDFSIAGSVSTTTNASGWFNLTIPTNDSRMYEPKITWTNDTTNAVDWIGKNLPAFPHEMLTQVAGTTFFLREAGTVNITAINSSGDRITFRYQVKDQNLGYPVAENFESNVQGAVVSFPRGRNYSIMVFPNESMPVSFDWNNFSSSQSYDLNSLSSYNVTTRTLHYQFNTTMNLVRVSGYTDLSGWDEFTVVPYLLEPGDMVHSAFGAMPYNLSGFIGGTDIYNLTGGFYNISLPTTPAETSNILLFATARNGSTYYGGFRNLSNLGAALDDFNFTMNGLLGSPTNISMEQLEGGEINISTAKQTFTILNSSNDALSNVDAHIETTVDYSGLGAIEFTWMSNIGQGSSSTFSLPLLNSTGIEDLNAFVGGGDYAPKRESYTAGQLQDSVDITVSSFNPGAIDSQLQASDVSMELYISNSTCDIPFPDESCLAAGESQTMENFDPISIIMGGGKLSFRMGTGNISVHYVNVDMLASGPPDALFDDSTTDSTSDTFESALRFGSGGPTIYDYVLISMPYAEGSSTQTGLNESADVNISIPLFYDDDWNVIWNATANGTSASALVSNYSHYEARQSDWANLLNETTCTTDNVTSAGMINSTNPCYIDTHDNLIWIRLPHFSGTGPKVSGSLVTAASTSSSSSSSSSSGGGGGGGFFSPSFWTSTYVFDEEEFQDSLMRALSAGHRIRLLVDGETHHVGVTAVTETTATVNVSSTPQQRTLSIGEEWKVDIDGDGRYDLLVRVESIDGEDVSLSVSPLDEPVEQPEEESLEPVAQEEQTSEETPEESVPAVQEEPPAPEETGSSAWLWILLVVVLAAGIGYAILMKKPALSR